MTETERGPTESEESDEEGARRMGEEAGDVCTPLVQSWKTRVSRVSHQGLSTDSSVTLVGGRVCVGPDRGCRSDRRVSGLSVVSYTLQPVGRPPNRPRDKSGGPLLLDRVSGDLGGDLGWDRTKEKENEGRVVK